MKIKIFQVDAFANQLFKGNPAAVCIVDEYPDDTVMQNIAAENNLAETAFVKKMDEGQFFIRWFTPCAEVELCGHATLASAYVLFQIFHHEGEMIQFDTLFRGTLKVRKEEDWLFLDFPSDELQVTEISNELIEAMQLRPESVFKGKTDFLLVYSSQKQIEQLKPDMKKLTALDTRGVIATAKGDEVDFVSRFFAPMIGIDEDPVTGSAHTALIPYWAQIMEKETFVARQLSARGGYLKCEFKGDRVIIGGQASLYMEGTIYVD